MILSDITITHGIKKEQIKNIVQSFKKIGWNKPEDIYTKYLEEQQHNKREIWIASYKQSFVGYTTLIWKSNYTPFKENSIPEIKDLNVLPTHQRKGIASTLLTEAEQTAFLSNNTVGIGVGVTADYANAHRLYIKRGYIIDGNGLVYRNNPIEYGNAVIADDDLCLMMTLKNKKLLQ